MEIISRLQARRSGGVKYFTGKTCLKGHLSERYVTSGRCCECARLSCHLHEKNNRQHRNKRQRMARQKNKEAVNAAKREAYHKNRDRMLLSQRKSREKHREKRLAYSRAYYEENKAKLQKMRDVIWAIRKEMPELLKEFGL